ncbi:MAG: MBL fold metallo-hydrolase [Clostridia bacterium]|nr:MBL fold metallo-hydrolase [Clostridia bacterium]
MKTTVHQLKTLGATLDGMCYVIQCDDGSTLVIDGGMPGGDAALLVEFLKKLAGDKKPVIDAWFFTHNHLDHTGAFFETAEMFADQVTVKKIIHRFLSEEFYSNCQPACVPELKRFIDDFAFFPGVEIVTPLAGDEFRFGSARIEILYTAADLPIKEGGKDNLVNDTSLVFRLWAEGQSVLFLGDVQEAGDNVMIERYGESLRSDVCQVAHHGAEASTVSFYKYVDPSILLWPRKAADMQYFMRMVPADVFLACGANVRDVYLAGHGNVSLEMPIRARETPYLPETVPPEKRDLTPELVIPRAACEPTLEKEDPVWDDVAAHEAKNDLNVLVRPGPGPDSAGFKMLWKENSLFLRLDFRKKIVSDPSRHGSSNCDCVRFYLAETPTSDPYLAWSDFKTDPGYISDLKLFPEAKIFGDKNLMNTHPDRCESRAYVDENGAVILAKISFASPHKSGDLIAFNVEFNGIREAGRGREYSLNYIEKKRFYHYCSPYYLPCAVLE